MYSHNQTTVWLLESPLAPYIDAFTEHFTQECYSPITIKITIIVLPTLLIGLISAILMFFTSMRK